MAKHDDLTPEQQDLYDALNNNNGTYIDLIEKATKEDIKAILDCKFDDDLSLLEFIVKINDIPLLNRVLKKLQKIYTEHPYDNEARELSRKFFTSLLEVEVNQEKKQVRPLDYIIINGYALADLFVTYATERKIDLEDLTIQNVGEVAENIDVKEFIELVEKKMKEAGLLIDQHTSHPTQNEQQPLQSNLQGTDPSASVPVEPVPAQVAEENAHQQASGSEQPSAFGEELPTTTSQDQQDNDNLTEDQQQELYGNLKSAIKGGDIVKLSSLLKSLSKEDLRRVLTKQKVASEGGITGALTLLCYALIFKGSGKEIEAILQNTFIIDNKDILKEILTAKQKVEFLDGSKHTLTPLAYALTFNDGKKKIEVILQNIKDTTLLREVLTAQQEVTFSDGSKHTLTLLGYAMLFNDSSKKIEAILQNIKDTTLLKEILTATQIVNGKECTLLQYADHYAPECATIIRDKLEEIGLLDQHTPHSTQNEQRPLQSNLQGSDPQVAAENAQQVQGGHPSAEEELSPTAPTSQDNDNFTEDQQQELYDNLKSAIEGNDIVKLSSLLQSLSKEDLKQVLTVKQEATFEDGITEILTLLGYAMNFYYGDEKIKVILENFSQYPVLLKEILTAKQEITFLDGSKRILTLLGYVVNFKDSKKEFEAILQSVDNKDLLKAILTAKQTVDGKEFTLLQYAYHYAPECATIIRDKLEEIGLPIDRHTSPPTLFDQHKGKAACGLGVAGVALVAFSFTVLSGFGAAAAFILGILALASAMAIAGKMVSEKAEKDGISKCDAVQSIISDIFSISGKEKKQEV